MIEFLSEDKYVFGWSYGDMPCLSTDVMVHKGSIKPEYRPFNQKLRRMKLEWTLNVKEEVVKQYSAGFLEIEDYSE